MQVRAALRCPAPRTATSKHLGKQVAECGRVIGAARREVEPFESAAPPIVARFEPMARVIA
jgi:hypothetical protein